MPDWILSLEVGEHLPQHAGEIFLESVARNARVGVVISWGVLMQPGDGHVNNQPNGFIIDFMTHHGFRHNQSLQTHLREQATYYWFKNSLMVFNR
jgi:hypothetical protein